MPKKRGSTIQNWQIPWKERLILTNWILNLYRKHLSYKLAPNHQELSSGLWLPSLHQSHDWYQNYLWSLFPPEVLDSVECFLIEVSLLQQNFTWGVGDVNMLSAMPAVGAPGSFSFGKIGWEERDGSTWNQVRRMQNWYKPLIVHHYPHFNSSSFISDWSIKQDEFYIDICLTLFSLCSWVNHKRIAEKKVERFCNMIIERWKIQKDQTLCDLLYLKDI